MTTVENTQSDTQSDSPELAAYKLKVRDEALRAQRETGWCGSGVNAVFARLGLDKLPTPQSFTFVVKTTGEIEYTVNAYDEAGAREAVASNVEYDRRRLSQGRGHLRPEYGRTTAVVMGEGMTLKGAPVAANDELLDVDDD